ncbi:MAG TPA: protein BatD [Verrucomicrobia bacterium]|nr:protein BatD [Verrucomicrobiota bacterium]HOP98505.1 hypothetical protein [Verrucomicrobiota bacterium]
MKDAERPRQQPSRIRAAALALVALIFPSVLFAQPTSTMPDPLLTLMLNQPSIEIATNIEVTAEFDPPAVRPGEKAIYRVTFNALDESIVWPTELTPPEGLELRQSARGMTLISIPGKLLPRTGINYHARTRTTGSFVMPAFEVQVYTQRVRVPEARLEVVPPGTSVPPPPRQLRFQLSRTNLFVGEATIAQIILPMIAPSVIQRLDQPKINGEGLLVDQGTIRQMVTALPQEGQAFIYQATVTPLTAGTLSLSAQGFTGGTSFAGTVVLQGQTTIPGGLSQFVLLDSDPIQITVRPLPDEGVLPGFTGAVGRFAPDPPLLSAGEVAVGQTLRLSVTVRGEFNVTRLVPPPPPRDPLWRVQPAVVTMTPPRGPMPVPGTWVTFVYDMTPLADDASATPPIPFSGFDPVKGEYVDLTIPSIPVRVTPGSNAADARPIIAANTAAAAEVNQPLQLSAIAATPGRQAASLRPLQQRRWFVALQATPLFCLIGLWVWDQRRRFHERHPEIRLRRRARRLFRRERRLAERAHAAGEATRFARHAVRAMRIACAPAEGAAPDALVCNDVLRCLNGVAGEKNGHETVRRLFDIADADAFSNGSVRTEGILDLKIETDRILAKLDEAL